MSYTNFCCRSGGSNLNAGTRTGDTTEPGTSADLTYTGGSWVSGTRVFTVASGDPVADGVVVGDYAALDTGGSSAALIGRVTARTSTTITINATFAGANPSNGTYTLRIGGAFEGPAGAVSFPFGLANGNAGLVNANGDRVRYNFKNNAAFSISAAMTHNISNGPVVFQGYSTNYGDGGISHIQGPATGSSFVHLTSNTAGICLVDMEFSRNGDSGSSNCLSLSGPGVLLLRVVVHDVRGSGFAIGSAASALVECEAYGCNQSNAANQSGFNLSSTSTAVRCIASNNTGSNTSGFYSAAGNNDAVFVDCIASENENKGFLVTSNHQHFFNCVAYFNGSDGIFASGVGSLYIENCILLRNGGYGINGNSAAKEGFIINCGYGSGAGLANTSGNTGGIRSVVSIGDITITADPWVNAASGDFRLNNTAGGGALLRGTGRGYFLQTESGQSGTVSYPDVGAVQHEETAGGGSTLFIPVVNTVLG
jgi:hypothetical protein